MKDAVGPHRPISNDKETDTMAEQQTRSKQQPGAGTTTAPTEQGHELLVAFGNTWKAPDDLEEQAVVTEVITEQAEKQIIETLYLEEEQEDGYLTESNFQAAVEETIDFSERYDAQPTEYTEKTVSYLTHDAPTCTCPDCDGALKVPCPNCTTGIVSCGRCYGDGVASCECGNGEIQCDTCRGRGTVTQNDETVTCTNCHGRGSFQCKDCGGRGNYRCPTCYGSGRVKCGTCHGSQQIACSECDAEGYVYRIKAGTVTFSTETETVGISDSGVPTKRVARAKGAKFDVQTDRFDPPPPGERGEIRQTTEYRVVPTTKVTYTYSDATYELFDIEGSLYAPSYPKSTYRKLAPYITLLLLLIIGTGIYVFFLQ